MDSPGSGRRSGSTASGLEEEPEVVEPVGSRRERSVSRSRSAPVLASLNTPLRELEGWLTKQGSHWRTWRERWFRLSTETGHLHYYKFMHDTQPLGSISLEGARLTLDESKFWRGTYGWVIHIEKPKKRELLLCTKQKQSREEWMNAIQALIYHYHIQSQPSLALSSSLSLPFLSTSSSFALKGSNSEVQSLSDSGSLTLTVDETVDAVPDTGSIHWRRTLWVAAYKQDEVCSTIGSSDETTKRCVEADTSDDLYPAGLLEPRGVLGLHGKNASAPVPVLADISDGHLAYAQLVFQGADYVDHHYLLVQRVKGEQEWRKEKAENERREREREREEKRANSADDAGEDTDSSGERGAVPTVSSAFPSVVKRVLFTGTEGWVQSVMMKNHGNLRIAASSFEEIQEWTRFLLSPPSSRAKSANHRAGAVNGFLWIGKEREMSWERFYCVTDGNKFEYYKIKNVELVDLKTITKVDTTLLVHGGPRKGSFINKREHLVDIRNYNHAVSVHTDSGEYGKKLSFMTQDEEQAAFWKAALEKDTASRVDTVKTVSLLKKSLEGIKNQPHHSADEFHPRVGRSNTELGASAPTPSVAHHSPVMLARAASDLSSAGSSAVRTAFSGDVTKHYLLAEAAVQGGVCIQSRLDRIANLARRLCERGDEETGKTPFGNYQAKKKVDVGDGHYRILSLDGGGLRAIIETVVLSRLLEVFPDLLQRVDLIAGVSGGAMVASGLVVGRSPAFICEMLKTFAPHFFKPKTRHTLQGLALNQAKFSSEPLLVFGDEIFKNVSIRDVPKRILIASFLLDNEEEDEYRNWEPRVYHNIPLKPDQNISSEEELSTPLWHAVMGSAAAPTFFPSFNKHVDGAVMINNPSLLALNMTMSEQVLNPVEPSRIHLLSLGTGHLRQFIGGNEHDWGVLQWAPKLPELLVAGGLASQLHMVKMLLGNRFHQLNPTFEKFLPMDDHTITNELIDIGMKVDLTQTIDWISEHFYNNVKKEPAPTPAKSHTRLSVREKRRAIRVNTNSDSEDPNEFRCDVGAWYNSALAAKPDK